MNDLISRQAAIETVRKAQSIGQAHRMLLQLPSAQPVNIAKLQPNCNQVASDCISRQAALTALERDEEYDKDIPNRADGVRDAIITISALPPAQPGWIPVTERLPEYGTTVLTCDHDGEYEINHIIDEEDGEWFLNGAVAWMPIPAPLEGDANG